MSNRNQHSKIGKLPDEYRDTLNQMLVKGRTYEDVVDYLQGLADEGKIEQDAVASLTSVGRYGKGFLRAFNRNSVVSRQAQALCLAAEKNGLQMEQAAVHLALGLFMDLLMPEDGEVDPKTLAASANALARLQSSGAARERTKIKMREDLDKRAKETADKVDASLKGKGISEETAKEIREKILGIASDAA